MKKTFLVLSIRLFQIPKVPDAYKWGLAAKISENGPPVFLAAKSREAAEKMFSILASFAAAAGAPLDFRDVGSAAGDTLLRTRRPASPRQGRSSLRSSALRSGT